MTPVLRLDRARLARLLVVVAVAVLVPAAAADGTGAARAWLPIPAEQTRSYNLSSMQVRGNAGAFAALRADGSVYAWGHAGSGGDWNSVRRYLTAATPTVQVFSNERAFAALQAGGSVVAWGSHIHGGDSDEFGRPRLIEGDAPITTIASTAAAFAALQSNGAVVAWGDSSSGGDAVGVPEGCPAPGEGPGACVSAPPGALDSGVVRLVAADGAFAALKDDGSVVTWGYSSTGGDSSAVSPQLASGVVEVVAGPSTFAALKDDGSVVAWGDSRYGGDPVCAPTDPPACVPAPPGALSSGVVRLYANWGSIAALKADGSVVAWGDAGYGGDPGEAVGAELSGDVVAITPSLSAFAALKADGSVVAWGDANSGGDVTYSGDPDGVAEQLASGVVEVYGNRNAFAALKEDGSVVTWGASDRGGYGSTPCGGACTAAPAGALESGVTRIFGNLNAFAALKADGSIVTWGHSTWGGDSSGVAARLAGGVVRVVTTEYALAALKTDGSVVLWGDAATGGAATGSGHELLDAGVETVVSPFYSPAYLPGAPTDVRVAPPAAGARSAVVTFAPPADDGGAPITGATATCSSPTGGAVTSASTTVPMEGRIAVDGLTLGATYTCTVVARNVVGAGPASEPSGAFTTAEVPTAVAASVPAAAPATRIPKLPARTTCGARGACAFHGVVPEGTTRVVLVATRLARGRGVRAIERVTRRCTITGAGSERTYACVVVLPRGRWSVAIRALGGRTVLAQSVDQVRIRERLPIPEAVTG